MTAHLGALTLKLDPLPRGIVLAATPLGNIGDASARLLQALAQADVIAAEDTRRVRALAQALGVEISGKVVSNFDHNEQERAQGLVDAARTGTVVVVTDAGMPIVSDPGLSLVRAAAEAGVPVTCFPGPSAVPTALALSGLGVGHFIFDGFAPRKSGQRKAWLESLRGQRRAVVFFESPHRVAATLADAAEVLGPQRRAAVCRELTKTYEEIARGSLEELAAWAANGVRGEVTVVIEGGAEEAVEVADLVARVEHLVAQGLRAKEACKQAAAGTGASVRELYDAYLAARDEVRDAAHDK
ncbi:16S rRNA (cytidine(1402)-2'-O)-methyltransferase [Corynebacterium lizhenjunii]|uniref:Ribosomal RNA small subunit methyltransferase I n=1 Tax=Corynebacterium lizhenjunii TaxID=2709394 RepID=A0A7T0KG65_9CORY|nr:16S rRNA (cytidine(1402)-2'-O)-methyltransferase [Corynebacterium lizhenjunii]QPK79811.1 16S rRNA (cytidine(1402)-2'-O)-methyltransferase [Corynebacterium lizhenjunii]